MASAEDRPNLLGPALPLVLAAVELGGRAVETGDPVGAHALYACAARLARRVRGLAEVADFRLERALEESESLTEPAEQAGCLRKAFDSLLPDTEPSSVPDQPLAVVQRFIELAISIGAPAYNLGDRQGCFDVYACTARMILASMPGGDAGQPHLRQALEESAALNNPDKQAWAMRHGFDAVLALGGPTAPALDPTAVRGLLAIAIQIGAPAFNLGDSRGCYEVYACTARLLLHSPPVAEEVKDHLRKALYEAAVIPDPARQAWVLRRAFDAILGTTPAADAENEPDEEADEAGD